MNCSLTERITESQVHYSPESDIQSESNTLNNNNNDHDDKKSSITQQPVQNLSSHRQLDNSFSIRPQRFPYEPNTIIDDRLYELSLKYEIQSELAERLRALQDYKIILLCDDSGSMKTPVDNTTRTRWDELCDFVKIVLEVGIIFDSTGVDIYFLNRRSIYNVINSNSVDEIFVNPPRGYTPLVSALRHIFQLPATRQDNDKKVLVFVATDGAPTDQNGNINVNDLEYLMIHERQAETTHVMFLICTDDSTCVDYLNKWDKEMTNVDITDDFQTEREAIRRNKGQNYPFSKGDYIVKALIGAIDPYVDNLNDRH